MIVKESKNDMRKRRHARVRAKLSGTAECPRLNVFRSNNGIYVQAGFILFDIKTTMTELKENYNFNGNIEDIDLYIKLSK